MEYLIKCPICEYSSKKSANVIRHLESKHKANSTHIDEFRRRLASSRAHELRGIRAWTCGLCGTTIPSKLGLERHIYRRHRMEYATREGKSLLMRKAYAEQPIEESLVLPQATTARPKMRRTTGCVACPVEYCQYLFQTRANLAEHFTEHHYLGSQLEKHSFASEAEFQTWLQEKDEQTCTAWKKRSSRDIGGRIVMYRLCRHEGLFKSSGTTSTNGKPCPAFLNVLTNELTGKVDVIGYYEHFGHHKDHRYRFLNDQETAIIFELADAGYSNPEIVKECMKYGETSRLSFLSCQDLSYLIKRRKKLREYEENWRSVHHDHTY